MHQLTVDAYAVQHPGGTHADKSIGIHLCGLHLMLERAVRSPRVPPLLQRLAERVDAWPHFPPPADRGTLTVLDVGMADTPADHAATVEQWARMVWQAWSEHHEAVAAMVSSRLQLD